MRTTVLAIGIAALVGAGWPSRGLAQRANRDPASAAAEIRDLRARGLDLLYNLDYGAALELFEHAVRLDPDDPGPHRLAASAVWMGLLFERGAILVDDYLGEARDVIDRPAPRPADDRLFKEHIARARALAEQRVRQHADDPDAHYQLGAAEGFLASYIATVEGRLAGSIGHSRTAFREHERVRRLQPSRKDAGLVPGMYRYSLSAMPMLTRWLARLAGIPSDREDGIRQVEAAAAYPGEAQSDAQFILIVIYNREGRYAEALQVIQQLQQAYPRNRLLWLEAATTALRATDLRAAQAALARGMALAATDTRRRAPGEAARWELARGMALLRSDPSAAADALRAALMHEPPRWVAGRVHRELGKLADLDGRREDALVEYDAAAQLCRAGRDRQCETDVERLVRRAFE